MSLSSTWTDVDLEAQGRQVGVVRVEHSVHGSAYGTIPIPLAVFANGIGPTILLMAGSHGDEYEGQLALTRLIRDIDLDRVRGRLFVVPAANLPAVMAGRRTSPLDDGNLNRSFSNSVADSPTRRIAAFIEDELMQRCDAVLDIHSGGSSLNHLPCSYADLGLDKITAERTLAALEAMGAPLSWAQPGSPSGPVAGHAALRKGALHLSGEFGGGGQLDRHALEITERCIYRLLGHFGLLPTDERWRGDFPTRFVSNVQRDFVYAPGNGVFEPLAVLGEMVEAGQLAGYLHTPELPLESPLAVYFDNGGMVAVIRAMGRSWRGDCLFQLLGEVDRGTILRSIEMLT